MKVTTTYSRSNNLRDYAESLGLSTRLKGAQTGTHYLTITSDTEEIIIRVANHADMYATSAYSADGVEGSDKGAKHIIAQLAGGDALAKLERREAAAAKAAATRKANRAAAIEKKIAPVIAARELAKAAFADGLATCAKKGTIADAMAAIKSLAKAHEIDTFTAADRRNKNAAIAAAATAINEIVGVVAPFEWTSNRERADMRAAAEATI